MKIKSILLSALCGVALCGSSALGQQETITAGRIIRGTGTNASYHSFVIPLDLQRGLVCSNTGGLANSLYPWNATGGTLYHYNATNASSATNLALRIPFINPIAGFGSRTGGDPLYYGQAYRFGLYSGQVSPNFTVAIILNTFAVTSTNWAFLNQTLIPMPNPANTNEWSAYLTNGYTRTVTTNGLTTIVNFDQTYQQWGTLFQGAITLTHIASPAASNYVFQVELVGVTDKGYMVYDGSGQPSWCRMYTVEFEQRPPWRAVFIDAPHFDGDPLPPAYQGKTTEELLTNTPPVTTTFTLSNAPATYTNLDQSPELRRHPILDQFVSDMRRDPIALARYVQNEIELTDAVSYNDNGSLSEISVNPPGVSRGALATFQEGQGGPAEQCALLIYLLRQAGVPAVYVYPPHNGLKMLDTRLSTLLRIQFKGAVNNVGQAYTTNRTIPVNYPWVAAYVGTNWVHIFPWLKDTSVIEGLNLYDYTGSNYRNGFQWLKDYLYGNTNILSLATDDDTAGVLFPRYVQSSLAATGPGISLDDLGVKFTNRRRAYARWQDFPTPLVSPTNGIALDSLSSPAITNVFSVMTNIFDLFSVEIRSVANTNKVVSSGFMRMVDIHNRRLLIRHEKTGANAHNLILSLAPFRPGATGLTNFTANDTLLNGQYSSVALNSTDDALKVTLVQYRHRMLPINYATNPPSPNVTYPGIYARTLIADTRDLRKGDLAAVCVNAGRVSRAMLNVHAQELWNMERTLELNPSATNSISPDLYQGGVAYLNGMAYYENISRTEQKLQELHKAQIISHYAHGLSKLSAKRVSGALPNSGDIILTQPNVDMSFQHSAIAFNGSIHSESGDEQFTALLSFRALWAAHGSSEEHQILNSFYKNSDSVSTTRLLQLAQLRATPTRAGIFALNNLNYVQMGNSNVNGTLLKNYEPAMWAQITNWLNQYDGRVNQVFLTPGTVTNNSASYKGMGAFMWSPGGNITAAISANLNGGFGPYQPDYYYSPANTPYYSLGVDPQGNYFFDATPPGASSITLAPDAFASYNAGGVANNASQNYYSYSGFQTTWDLMVRDYLNLGSQGSQNLNYAQGVDASYGDNGFLGWTGDGTSQYGSGVADPVHMVTGEFYVNTTDLALPGPMPLTVTRNYSSLNVAANELGYGWKLNFMPYLSINSGSNIIYAAEVDGAVIAYEKTATNANVYLPTTAKNPLLNNNNSAGIGSVANRLRSRIEKQVSGPDAFYYLYPPTGGKRTFKVLSFTGSVDRTRPYLIQWEDNRANYFTFEYGTDSTQADYAQVRRVQSSNGNYLGFRYDAYGRIIEAYAGDGRRVLFDFDRYGDLAAVTHPDQSRIEYEYEHKSQSITNGSTVTVALYSTHLLLKENKPDGRVLKNEYDQHRRVTNQWATVGPDLNLVRNATFIYSNNFNLTNSYTNTITGFTIIEDVFNNTNRYDYTNSLITKITDALNQTVIQDWYVSSETNKAGYYPRSLESRTDVRGLTTYFKYDANGNVTNTVVTGDLTGDGTTQSATNTITYDTNNLPTLTVDPVGNKVQTIYHAQFPFLPEYIVRLAGSTPISTNRMFYTSVTNTLSFGGVNYTNLAIGLLQREIRAFGSTDAATNDYAYDGRGFITQSVRYTGTTDPAVTNTFFYNDRNQLTEQTDAAGRKTKLDYDAMGRPILREVYEAGQTLPLAWEYSYFNDNGELTWSDGPRYNPEDYVWRDYDGSGRNITEIHWRSQAKNDGSGVEAPAGYNLYAQTFREFDAFGNLKRTINPLGAITTNTWDVLGRLVQAKAFDFNGTTVLSTEGFAYEPGGQVRFHTNALGGVTETQYTTNGLPKFRKNADGSTNAWRYYVDGRTYREIEGNGAYWQSTYDDANRRTSRIFYSAAGTPLATNLAELDRRGNLVKRTDEGGFVFTNAFDGLDRVKISAGPPVVTVHEACGPVPGCGNWVTNILQQKITYFYDAAGVTTTNVNALGEKTIAITDALGRPVKTEIRDTNNVLVRVTSTAYAADHHSVTVTNGTGAAAIVSTTYTDTDGRTVLAVAYPNANSREFTLTDYDLAGNLIYQERDSFTNGVVTAWTGTGAAYDGLNRPVVKSDRDAAVTTYAYNPLGNVTNRTMPGGLQWQARFNNAGQMLEEKNVGSGGAATRTNTYTYFTAGSPFAGLLQTQTDGRGVACTYSYDDWLRVATNIHSTVVGGNSMISTWKYDSRGMVTNIYEWLYGNLPMQIARTFDAYGQLLSENGIGQSWDAAGRRTKLDYGTFSYSFGWRADGTLASVATPQGGCSYNYNAAGILTNRNVGARSTYITALDGVGRPLAITNKVSLIAKLSETLRWTGDGLLSAHTVEHAGDFTDARTYDYAVNSRRLTTERLNLDAAKRWTNSFTYDNGVAHGPGALTKVAAPATSPQWSANLDNFSRLNQETNPALRTVAYGRVNGTAAVAALLDGQPATLAQVNTGDSVWVRQWRSPLELGPGTHQLSVTATHPSGKFATNQTIWFTNSAASKTGVAVYDGAGNVSRRIWLNANGTTNRTQTFEWDPKGRLSQVYDLDSQTNGYHWWPTYDGLGRRYSIRQRLYANGVVVQDRLFYPRYDPLVEFLEVGIYEDRQTAWKVYGPDLNGVYGGMQGTGGFEAAVPDQFAFIPTLADARGNVLGGVTNGLVNWTAARPTGYGAVPGYRPLPYGYGGDLISSAAWRGRRQDLLDFLWLGARYYNPESGSFLSSDPMWNDRDPNFYSFAGGDPINWFDPTGRYGKQNSVNWGQWAKGALSDFLTGDDSGPWTSDPAVIHDYNVTMQLQAARQQWYDNLPPDQQAAYGSLIPFKFNLTQFSDNMDSGNWAAAGRNAEGIAAEAALMAMTFRMFGGPQEPPMPTRQPLLLTEGTLESRVGTAYQNFYNDAWTATVNDFNQGNISIPAGQSWRTVLGQRTDAAARDMLKDFLNAQEIPQGQGGLVLVNRRLYDPSGSGAYRIPDVNIPSAGVIFDGTIGIKTLATPQIQDFINWSGSRVNIVSPTVLPRP